MATVRLDELFEMRNGHGFALANMTEAASGEGVNFIARTGNNNGVTGHVVPPVGVRLGEPGDLTVAMSGTVLATFLQEDYFVCGYHVAILTPKRDMSMEERLYYAQCIRENAVRYSYGRQANRTLPSLQLPATTPGWVYDYSVDTILGEFDKAMAERKSDVAVGHNIDTSDWVDFRIGDLFEIKRGKSPSINRLPDGSTPVVSSKGFDNGVVKYAEIEPTFEAGLITVAADGSVGFATVQPEPFVATGHVAVWLPREISRGMSTLAKLGLCALIRLEGPRYGFGRAWGIERMENTHIRLPAVLDESGDVTPDWDRLDAKMRELAFSQYVAMGKL